MVIYTSQPKAIDNLQAAVIRLANGLYYKMFLFPKNINIPQTPFLKWTKLETNLDTKLNKSDSKNCLN